MRSRLISGLVALGLALGLATTTSPASASTGGTPDTSNKYSNVGLLVFYSDGLRYRCSGTLVSPTIVLTAAHCTDGTAGKTAVTFAPVIAKQAPSGLPTAEDPDAGYTGSELGTTTYYYGESYTHTRYSNFTDLDNWNDVGVIELDTPVSTLPAGEIAALRTLNAYQQPRLNKTLFTGVGYGTEVRKPDSGPQKPEPMSYPLVRRYVEMPGQKLTSQILQTNGNDKDPRGTGGTCFGDSGGPVFLKGEIVAVTSYVYTSNCRYLGGYQRVDIAVVQNWLKTFGLDL